MRARAACTYQSPPLPLTTPLTTLPQFCCTFLASLQPCKSFEYLCSPSGGSSGRAEARQEWRPAALATTTHQAALATPSRPCCWCCCNSCSSLVALTHFRKVGSSSGGIAWHLLKTCLARGGEGERMGKLYRCLRRSRRCCRCCFLRQHA